MKAHFIGSIIYVNNDPYAASGIKELTIIDGQHRLTTLTLIYLVLYRLAKVLNNDLLVNKIYETYLINKFAPEEEKSKLRLTNDNEKALRHLLRSDENEDFSDYSKLIDNFNYFKGRITEENNQVIEMGLSKLMFVEISLEHDEDKPIIAYLLRKRG